MIDDCLKEKIREVPASEILAKIMEGEEVEYDYVIPRHPLSISGRVSRFIYS